MIKDRATRRKLSKEFIETCLNDVNVQDPHDILRLLSYWSLLRPGYADQDYGYLITLLSQRLNEMSDKFDKKRAEEMKLCTRLIPIATSNDPTPYNGHVNDRNLKRIVGKRRLDEINLMCVIPIARRRTIRMEKAWHLLFYILQTRMKSWWI